MYALVISQMTANILVTDYLKTNVSLFGDEKEYFFHLSLNISGLIMFFQLICFMGKKRRRRKKKRYCCYFINSN